LRFRDSVYQPSLAAVQVALARTAEQLGLVAQAVCGSGVGELVAAHLAGVFDRTQLVTVLAARDRLMRAAPEGRMMATSCSSEEATALLLPEVEIAGDIWEDRVLLSGPRHAVAEQQRILTERGVDARILPGRIAPHKRLMTDAGDEFRGVLSGMTLGPAMRPLVSTLTGTWVGPDQLADPEHWVRQLCEPLRFREALKTLTKSGRRIFVESSPGTALTSLTRRACGSDKRAMSLGGEPDTSPLASFLSALGELWSTGIPVDWEAANGTSKTPFVSLPSYPFQRRRFWNHTPEIDNNTPEVVSAPSHRLDGPDR
jgi:acyl transferase domain-containing protein